MWSSRQPRQLKINICIFFVTPCYFEDNDMQHDQPLLIFYQLSLHYDLFYSSKNGKIITMEIRAPASNQIACRLRQSAAIFNPILSLFYLVHNGTFPGQVTQSSIYDYNPYYLVINHSRLLKDSRALKLFLYCNAVNKFSTWNFLVSKSFLNGLKLPHIFTRCQKYKYLIVGLLSSGIRIMV